MDTWLLIERLIKLPAFLIPVVDSCRQCFGPYRSPTTPHAREVKSLLFDTIYFPIFFMFLKFLHRIIMLPFGLQYFNTVRNKF